MFYRCNAPFFSSGLILQQYKKVGLSPILIKCLMCHRKWKINVAIFAAQQQKTPSMAQLWAVQQIQSGLFRTSAQLSFNEEPDTRQKSLLSRGDWTPRVQPQSAFRVATPWKSHSRGQRLMGSCGSGMDGWVSWLGAARTEKGCSARRREATSDKDILGADIVQNVHLTVVLDLCIKSNCMTQFRKRRN